MGIQDEEIATWDPDLPGGGLQTAEIIRARMILWKGWCPVHCPVFTVADVARVRAQYPGITIMVHPETDPATVKAATSSGSTSQILDYIASLPKGSRLAVGTEANMVLRAAKNNAGRVEIIPLKEIYCDDMAKITLPKLAMSLAGMTKGQGKVELSEAVAADARRALDAMLRI